jgi:hypothetical protein
LSHKRNFVRNRRCMSLKSRFSYSSLRVLSLTFCRRISAIGAYIHTSALLPLSCKRDTDGGLLVLLLHWHTLISQQRFLAQIDSSATKPGLRVEPRRAARFPSPLLALPCRQPVSLPTCGRSARLCVRVSAPEAWRIWTPSSLFPPLILLAADFLDGPE